MRFRFQADVYPILHHLLSEWRDCRLLQHPSIVWIHPLLLRQWIGRKSFLAFFRYLHHVEFMPAVVVFHDRYSTYTLNIINWWVERNEFEWIYFEHLHQYEKLRGCQIHRMSFRKASANRLNKWFPRHRGVVSATQFDFVLRMYDYCDKMEYIKNTPCILYQGVCWRTQKTPSGRVLLPLTGSPRWNQIQGLNGKCIYQWELVKTTGRHLLLTEYA